jgi:hypothetical protein
MLEIITSARLRLLETVPDRALSLCFARQSENGKFAEPPSDSPNRESPQTRRTGSRFATMLMRTIIYGADYCGRSIRTFEPVGQSIIRDIQRV